MERSRGDTVKEVTRVGRAAIRLERGGREDMTLEEAIMARDIALLLSVLAAARQSMRSTRKAA